MRVDGIEFTSQTEYLAALRDRNRIEAIKARVDVTDTQVAGTLYKRLKSQPYYFETEVGRKFLKDLSRTAGASASGKNIIKNRVDHSEELEELERRARDNYREDLPAEKKDRKKPERRQGTSRVNTDLPRKSGITILEGSDELMDRYNSDFSRSRAIDELSRGGREKNEFWDDEDDLTESEVKPEKSKNLQKLLLMLVGAAAAIILVVFLGKEVKSRIEDYQSAKKLKELQNIVLQATDATNQRLDGVINAWASDGSKPTQAPDTETPTSKPEKPAIPTVLPEFEKLYNRNEDLVGWIQIPGTVVNYPVMQKIDDMEYYLLRDFDGKSDKNGLPFVDNRSNVFEPTTNVIIYGHCMNSGSMFASLLNYKEKSYYEAHPVIYFDTIYERAEYEIVAAFQSKIAFVGEKAFRYYNFIDTDSEEEFNEFINTAKSISYYETGVTASLGDDLITLSTCDKEIKNGRMVVIARRISSKQ